MKAYEWYIRRVSDMLAEALTNQSEALEAAAQLIFTSLRKGGMLYTFGTGHGHLLAEEVFYRAGGPVRVCPILDERLMLHLSASESTAWERKANIADEVLSRYNLRLGDVLLIASNSGRNAAPVEMAALAQKRGIPVIALTNLRHSAGVTSRNALGKRLFEVASIVLDNCGVPGDAVWTAIDGSAVGPASTAVGAALLQAMLCRVRELSDQEGAALEFFVSSNVDGGDEINERLIAENRSEVPHL